MSRLTLSSMNWSKAFIHSLEVDIEVPPFEVCTQEHVNTRAGVRPRCRGGSRWIKMDALNITHNIIGIAVIASAKECLSNFRIMGIYTNGKSVTLVRQLSVSRQVSRS